MDPIQLLEYSGCLLGIIGGALNCSADIHKKIWAFRTWFVSNLMLAYWGFLTGNWGQVAMYTFFLGTSYYGMAVHKE
jgi:hypothetical protein